MTTHETADGRVRIYDVSLGVEAARSMTLTDVDDPDDATLFRAASCFQRTQ